MWFAVGVALSGGPASNAGMVSALRMLRILRLAKLAKTMNSLARVLENSVSTAVCAMSRVAACLACLFLWCHSIACIWLFLGKDGWAMHYEFVQSDLPYKYVASLQWALAQFQGSTDIAAGFYLSERMFHAFAMSISMVLLASFGSSLTSVLVDMSYRRQKCAKNMELVLEYMAAHSISVSLSSKVRRHIQNECNSNGTGTFNLEKDVLRMLPQDLCRKLLSESRERFLCSGVVFRSWSYLDSTSFQILCCDTFTLIEFAPDELLFSFAETSEKVLVVRSGHLHYAYSSMLSMAMKTGVSACLLSELHAKMRSKPGFFALHSVKAGAILSEATIWCPWVHQGDLSSRNYGSVLALKVAELLPLVSRFIVVRGMVLEHASIFVEMLNSCVRSDLFDSRAVLDEVLSFP